MQLADELGDRRGRAASLHQLAVTEETQGNLAEARSLLRESIQSMDELGDRYGRAMSLIALGRLDAREGHLEHGRAQVQEGVDILEQLGSGDLDQARQILRAMQGAQPAMR